MDFLPFMKAVGTGQKRNRDLSKDEMKQIMRAILNENIYPEQVSAFLLGWRVKGETLEELKGALEVFDKFIIQQPLPNSIEFGYPYDGKVKNPYLIFLSAQYLQKFDLQLALHGDILQPSKCGTTLKKIYENSNLQKNIHFFDRSIFFPELHKLSKIRNRLGIRTSFNTLEKLPGVTQSETAILGAFHKPFIDKYIHLFKNRYKRLIIIKGNEGTPEIFSKCSIFIVENNQMKEIKIDPKDFDIDYKKSTRRITFEESLAFIQKPDIKLLALAKFYAAVILFLTERTQSIQEGMALIQD